MHMLVRCPEARIIWRLSPLRLECDSGTTSSLTSWIDGFLHQINDVRWWSLFWATVWGIWLLRNLWVYEAKRRIDLQRVVQQAIGIANEYEEANKSKRGEIKQLAGPRSWLPPEETWYKVNVDAAVFEGDWIGLGAILRDTTGDPLLVACNRVQGSNNAEVAEALAARFGLITTLEAGFSKIILESDCLKLVTHLRKQFRDKTPFGIIVGDILTLLSRCSSFQVSHVRRQGNRVAHELAKGSSSFEDFRVWLEETPGFIQSLVTNDIMLMNE